MSIRGNSQNSAQRQREQRIRDAEIVRSNNRLGLDAAGNQKIDPYGTPIYSGGASLGAHDGSGPYGTKTAEEKRQEGLELVRAKNGGGTSYPTAARPSAPLVTSPLQNPTPAPAPTPTPAPVPSPGGNPAPISGTGLVDGILTDDSSESFAPTAPGPNEGIGEHDPALIGPNANSTVAGQMGNLMDKDSRYMQLARTTALQKANARGLVNSSIAIGSAQDAAIRAAMPIAQQDAATSFQTDTANQSALNKVNENEQAFDINRGLAEQEQRQLLDRLEYDSMTKEDQARLDTSLEMLSDENKAKLQAEMEVFVKNAEITASQKQMYAQESANLMQITQERIADININANKSLTATQQAAAIQHLLDTQDAQLTLYRDLMLSSGGWPW